MDNHEMPPENNNSSWPELDYRRWEPTCTALHLWVQIVGKFKLANTPWVNHSWHATLDVTPRGLCTGAVPTPDGGAITIEFDLYENKLIAFNSDGDTRSLLLRPMAVATFWAETVELIKALGGNPVFHSRPNELPDPVPFKEDFKQRPYDADAVRRFHRALLRVDGVFNRFRTSYLGKASPVHLFWGSFDLAVTRFSGRRAPLHPGGVTYLPDDVVREAYSHEVSSAGFWPGGAGVDEAMFYSYAYPEPPGFQEWKVEPKETFYSSDLGEFLLPYEAVRRSEDPEATLMDFLRTTYEAAAHCGGWEREALECELGKPGVPRAVNR